MFKLFGSRLNFNKTGPNKKVIKMEKSVISNLFIINLILFARGDDKIA